jgi:hypothetical protein
MQAKLSQRASAQRSIDVVVSWAGTALCVERLARAQTFTIGASPPSSHEARHFLFDHPSLPSTSFPLVEHRADGSVIVRAAEGMSLALDGAPISLSEIALAKGARARVTVGPLCVEIAGDKRADTVVNTLVDFVDSRLLRVSGVALALHAGFVVALLFTQSPPPLDLFAGTNGPRWSSTLTAPRVKPKPLAEFQPAKPREQSSSQKTSPRKALASAKKAGPSARDLAQQAIAQMFGGADATSKVFGDGGINAGLGDLRGAMVAGVDNGAGVRRGPGGIGDGVKGIGGIRGRIGDGDPTGDGDITLPTRKNQIIVDVFTPPVQNGDGLTREEIQRVLKRVMPQIKYCYEKELNREPTLEGKLTSSWTITKDGSVSGAQLSATTMQKTGGDQVGTCVTRVLSRLQFPAPRGGGQVVVTYPFVFSTAGAR